MNVLLRYVFIVAALASSSLAQTVRPIYTFTGSDGAGPTGGLIQDANGKVYGATRGGTGNGTVFRVSLSGQEQTLHIFQQFTDGNVPSGSLVWGSNGNLYGATVLGGTHGVGTIFEVDTAGRETVIYNFPGYQDGAQPNGGLITDAAGNLYGATNYGGNRCSYTFAGCGVIFKMDATGKETVLYRFSGGSDGGIPNGNLIRDARGNLYGTSAYGGVTSSKCGVAGCGVVFELTTAGKMIVLHAFLAGADAAFPVAGLTRDATSGTLYGTTSFGGTSDRGTVFAVSSTGIETVLHSFCDCDNDGNYPTGQLARDGKGTLHGVTGQGGASNFGTVFNVDTAGEETVLNSFTGGYQGAYPAGRLLIDATGKIYGAAGGGGSSDDGTIFEIIP